MAKKISQLSGSVQRTPNGKYKQFYYDAVGRRKAATADTANAAVSRAMEQSGGDDSTKMDLASGEQFKGKPRSSSTGKRITHDVTKFPVQRGHVPNIAKVRPAELTPGFHDHNYPGVPAKITERTTFAALGERFIFDSENGRDGAEPLQADTVKAYRIYLRKHCYPLIGMEKIGKIDVSHLRLVRDTCLAKDTIGRTTAKAILRCLKLALNYAEGMKWITPIAGMTQIQVQIDWNHQKQILENRIPSRDDILRLDLEAKNSYEGDDYNISKAFRRYYPFYLLLRLSGMRSSEIIGLQWEDFNEDYTYVNVTRSVCPPKKGMTQAQRVSRVKSKNGRRRIPLSSAITPIMQQWREECMRTRDGWVFPTQAGNPINYSNVYTHFWKPLLNRADVEPFGMHGMRHFYASILIKKGGIKVLQSMLGHHSSAFTMDVYGHLLDEGDGQMQNLAEMVADRHNIAGGLGGLND